MAASPTADGQLHIPTLFFHRHNKADEPAVRLVNRAEDLDIWARYWPQHNDIWPGVNTATKYIASNTMTSHRWQPSVFLNGDIADKITQIKQQDGPDLHVYGSANLVQTLLKHDLVDAFWLKIFPVTLGGGKRLFSDGGFQRLSGDGERSHLEGRHHG